MSSEDFVARGMMRNLVERLNSRRPGEGQDLIGTPSVRELAESTHPSRGTGAKWSAEGFSFTEATPDATDHHLTTAGGVKLYFGNAPTLFRPEQMTELPNINGQSVQIAAGGGAWRFDASDLSAKVTIDPHRLLYRAPDSDSTGASGAWVRQDADTQFFYPEDFGASGNGTLAGGGSDDAPAINACDLAASAVGGTVVLRGSYRTESQVLMSSDWRFEGGTIIRDWTTVVANKDVCATIKGRGNDAFAAFYTDPGPYVPTGVLNGLSITGKGSVVMSDDARAYYDTYNSSASGGDYRATTLYMLCDNFTLEAGVKFELGGNDWCIVFGGDHFAGAPNITINPNTAGPYILEDGFHAFFGHHGALLPGTDIESGDDCISFHNPNNLAISNWTVTSPKVWSRLAYGIKIAAQRVGGTASYGAITKAIENIVVVNPQWKRKDEVPSRNGFVAIDCSEGSTSGAQGIIQNCRVTGGDFTAAQNNGLPTGETTGQAGLQILGPATDCFIEARCRYPSRSVARHAVRPGGTLGPIRCGIEVYCPDVTNWQGATAFPLQTEGQTTDCWFDGDVMGGAVSGTQRGALGIATDGKATTGFYANRLILRNTPTGTSAVNTNTAMDGFTVRERLDVFKGNGSTNTRALSATAIPYHINGYGGDVPQVCSNPSTPTKFNVSMREGQDITQTVGAGIINYFGGANYAVSCEGGVSDSLSTINNGRKGQRICIRNAEAAPGTAILSVTNSGNIVLGSSPRALNDANSRLWLIYDGTNWQEERFV